MSFHNIGGFMKINDKIRFIRKERNWTQEFMAEKLDMTVNSYSNIERGVTDIKNSRLEEIAKIFDTGLLDLYNYGEKEVNCLAGDNNQNIQNLIFSQEATAYEIQKMRLMVEQQTKEISYLKEIIELMKKKDNA